MRRCILHCGNAFLLAVIFLGAHAATSLELGRWRLTARAETDQLLLWALGAGSVANGLLAWFTKKKKIRENTLYWLVIYLILLLTTWCHAQGLLSFHWLKR